MAISITLVRSGSVPYGTGSAGTTTFSYTVDAGDVVVLATKYTAGVSVSWSAGSPTSLAARSQTSIEAGYYPTTSGTYFVHNTAGTFTISLSPAYGGGSVPYTLLKIAGANTTTPFVQRLSFNANAASTLATFANTNNRPLAIMSGGSPKAGYTGLGGTPAPYWHATSPDTWGPAYVSSTSVLLLAEVNAAVVKVDTIVSQDTSTTYAVAMQDATVNARNTIQAETAMFQMTSGEHDSVITTPRIVVEAETASYQMTMQAATVNAGDSVKVDTATYSMTTHEAQALATEVIKAETARFVMSSDNHSTGGASAVFVETAKFEMTSGVHGARNFGLPSKQAYSVAHPANGAEGPGTNATIWNAPQYATGPVANTAIGETDYYASYGTNNGNLPQTSNYLMLTGLGLSLIHI